MSHTYESVMLQSSLAIANPGCNKCSATTNKISCTEFEWHASRVISLGYTEHSYNEPKSANHTRFSSVRTNFFTFTLTHQELQLLSMLCHDTFHVWPVMPEISLR